jgi:hypothetical protein
MKNLRTKLIERVLIELPYSSIVPDLDDVVCLLYAICQLPNGAVLPSDLRNTPVHILIYAFLMNDFEEVPRRLARHLKPASTVVWRLNEQSEEDSECVPALAA